jgi:hypothetical protein
MQILQLAKIVYTCYKKSTWYKTTLFQPTTATFKRYTTRRERLDRHLPRRRRASTSFLLRANIIRTTALQFRQTARPPTR